MDEQMLNQIASLLQTELKRQLLVPRKSTTYSGIAKPVSGRYPTPISGAKASGRLYNSIKAFWVTTLDSPEPELIVEMEEYGFAINDGRKPNSKNSGGLKSALTEWAKIKPLPRFRDKKGRFITNEQRAIMITRSVAKYGYGGNNFINKAIENTLPKIEDQLGEAIRIWFEDKLGRFDQED